MSRTKHARTDKDAKRKMLEIEINRAWRMVLRASREYQDAFSQMLDSDVLNAPDDCKEERAVFDADRAFQNACLAWARLRKKAGTL